MRATRCIRTRSITFQSNTNITSNHLCKSPGPIPAQTNFRAQTVKQTCESRTDAFQPPIRSGTPRTICKCTQQHLNTLRTSMIPNASSIIRSVFLRHLLDKVRSCTEQHTLRNISDGGSVGSMMLCCRHGNDKLNQRSRCVIVLHAARLRVGRPVKPKSEKIRGKLLERCLFAMHSRKRRLQDACMVLESTDYRGYGWRLVEEKKSGDRQIRITI